MSKFHVLIFNAFQEIKRIRMSRRIIGSKDLAPPKIRIVFYFNIYPIFIKDSRAVGATQITIDC